MQPRIDSADRQALQDLLLRICSKAKLEAPALPDTQAVLDDIVDEARSIVADIAYNWNRAGTLLRLPSEVLATCFSFLPFPCMVTASHVSRAWRDIALHTPSLWACINESRGASRLTVPVVQMALSRAGMLPLQFEIRHELKGALLQLVRNSMYRVCSMELRTLDDESLLEQPAPLLHTLRVTDRGIRLTPDLLAKRPSRLKILQSDQIHFPASCPALSTLTSLCTEYCGHATLQALFATCPCLETLSVDRVYSYNIAEIGPPPHALADLVLGTIELTEQLLSVYDECKTWPKLKHIALQFEHGCAAARLGPVLLGAADLKVAWASGIFNITALYPGGGQLRLALHGMHARYQTAGFPPIFKQSAECFAALDTLRIPLSILAAFVADAPPVPALMDLRLEVSANELVGEGAESRFEYPWALLRPLGAAAPRRVFLDVRPRKTGPSSSDFPTMDDARALVDALIGSEADITIQGFPRGVVPVDTEFMRGRSIHFLS